MSCLKFFNDNLVTETTTIGTPSTVNASFPLSNLNDPRRTKVFRTTSNSGNIVFDFGSAKAIDSIFIVGNSQTGLGINSLTLELNSSDSWGAPAFSQVISLSSEFNQGIASFTSQTYRYARIVFTSSASFCEISKLFIGQAIDLDRGPSFNWTYKSEDLSKVTENRYAQKFVDIISRRKRLSLSLSLLNKDQMELFFSLYDSKGLTYPFFIELGSDNMIDDHRRFSGLVYLNSIPTITNTYFNRYSLSIEVEEGM